MKIARIAPALLLTAAVVGCGGEQQAATGETATTAGDPAPESPSGVRLSAARVQLPVIAGRPGVAYFTAHQNGDGARAIAAVHVEGAGRSEIHETRQVQGASRMARVEQVPLTRGKELAFAPGGYHVMLFDLAPTLTAGSTAELTVTFENGDKATVEATVEAVGGKGGGSAP
jgi:copper(I)-binding protein